MLRTITASQINDESLKKTLVLSLDDLSSIQFDVRSPSHKAPPWAVCFSGLLGVFGTSCEPSPSYVDLCATTSPAVTCGGFGSNEPRLSRIHSAALRFDSSEAALS